MTRGSSRMRVDRSSRTSNSTSHSSTAPVIGAALRRLGRAGERDVPLAGEAGPRSGRGRPSPRPGRYDLRPGVQVGEVVRRPARAVERLHVRRRAGSGSPTRSAPRSPRWRSTCTSSQAESRHEPLPALERLLGRLHARLHADDVADSLLQRAGSASTRKSIVRPRRARRSPRGTRASRGPAGAGLAVRARAPWRAPASYANGQCSAVGSRKKSNGLMTVQLGDQVDLDLEARRSASGTRARAR